MVHTFKASRKGGFTLLELLAAMGVLVLVVMMMSRVFTDTTRMWNLGTKRIVEAQEARAVMNFLVQEISTAMADSLISFRMHSEVNPALSMSVSAYGEDTDSLAFLAFTQTPPWGATGANHAGNDSWRRRATTQFIYFVDYMIDEFGDDMDDSHELGPRYRLVRARGTRSSHTVDDLPTRPPGLINSAYHRTDWWREEFNTDVLGNIETIAVNVVAFELWAYTEAGNYIFNFDSVTQGEPPLWIDLYLEMMGEAEIAQLAQMWKNNHPDRLDFRERNVRRYSARVYLRNREGYLL